MLSCWKRPARERSPGKTRRRERAQVSSHLSYSEAILDLIQIAAGPADTT